jgi:proteasome accessory factor C
LSPRPDAASRLRRLLTLIPWVVDHQGAQLDEIARRFGISVSELERDLELIPFCGLPPYSPDRLIDCQIVDGRVFLRFAEYFRRPVSLTPSEGFTLLAAGRALLGVPGADAGGSLASALEKLETVLGGAEGMTVELGEGPFLEDLRRAAEAHQRVEIDYYAFGRDALTRRQIDPHAVFTAEGQWYVDAYCHQAKDDRLFRVDRVAAVRPTGELFEAVVRQAPLVGVFHPSESDPRVTLMLHPDVAWVVEAFPTESVETAADGRLRVVLAVSGRAWLERLLLRLGPAAEVTDPPEMVRLASEAARRVLGRYTARAT